MIPGAPQIGNAVSCQPPNRLPERLCLAAAPCSLACATSARRFTQTYTSNPNPEAPIDRNRDILHVEPLLSFRPKEIRTQRKYCRRQGGLHCRKLAEPYTCVSLSWASPASFACFEETEEELTKNVGSLGFDFEEQPELAKQQQIIAAPTLVKQLPQPLRKVVGDMADPGRALLVLGIRPPASG